MLYCELKPGQVFEFSQSSGTFWEYRGNNYFGRPWSGGPYYMEPGKARRQTVYPAGPEHNFGRCEYCGAVKDPDNPECTVAMNTLDGCPGRIEGARRIANAVSI